MEHRFLAAIDAAVDRALPAGWPRLPHAWLPARGSVRARHAFRLANRTGPASYLAVIAVPPFAARTAAAEGDLAALVDHVLARGANLLLLYDHEDDPNGWVAEHIDFPHPRFLCLPCIPPRAAAATAPGPCAGSAAAGDARENDKTSDAGHCSHDYTSEPTHGRRELLSDTIRGLWSGELFYHGPCEGMQTVGIEIMKDNCWRCHASLDTVTGIVFPDREVSDWSRPDWTYFQALLPLARIPDSMIPDLSAAMEAWRAAGDRRLAVIRWRYSKTVEYAYWAAECPACGSFRGDWPLMEARMQWLNDLESRRMGILSYRPLRLDVPRAALQELTWGGEVNPHVRFLGWYRTGDQELEGSTAIEGFRAATVLAFADGTDGHTSLPGDAGPHRAAGVHGSAESNGPDLPHGTATSLPSNEITGTADLGLPKAPPAASAVLSVHGPLQRLGEILATWLGWMGAGCLPPEATGTETETAAAASAALAATSPCPAAPTALSRNHP